MEMTFQRCKEIADTLPIGLYTGRRIPVTVDEKEETSYYSPMEDNIVVSYPIIAERVKNIEDENYNEEEAIRSMLYHEVSHAILTPIDMKPSNIVNIFEDERIESILRGYYHGVNFRKQLYDIHGGHAPKATNDEQAFFNAVRFGLGTAKIQAEIRRIKDKYKTLNRNSAWHSSKHDEGYEAYEYDIRKLYELIRKEFSSHPESFNEKEGKEGKGSGKQMDKLKSGQGKNDEKGQTSGELQMGENNDENETEGLSLFDRDPLTNEEREALQRMVGQSLGKQPNLNDAQQEQLDNFRKTAEMIIENFNKKNNGGSGINSYSGVFNPRNVVRKDYRFFDRAMTTQGNNKFGTCHLNLIIDCSGSFCNNVALTNGILAVLSEIERKNRNFSMDVAFINHEFHLCESVRERKMKAWGGNNVPKNMKEILTKLQKPQTCNYNIVLFDGDAICNYGLSEKESRKIFGAFDMKQTTLITDPENEQYMKPPFTSTKVIVTKNYTTELIKHITNALTIAFG